MNEYIIEIMTAWMIQQTNQVVQAVILFGRQYALTRKEQTSNLNVQVY